MPREYIEAEEYKGFTIGRWLKEQGDGEVSFKVPHFDVIDKVWRVVETCLSDEDARKFVDLQCDGVT
jgi:hypothetical protein